jgi:glycosyltransferase involved in cell wall biosynthesis
MEAAAILRSKGVKAQFRLLGKPELVHPESVSQDRLQQWEAEGLLENLGFADDVREALSGADCFVLPTYYEEGIPRTLMEASSMGKPVITSDHTGCNSVVEDGVNGLLCKPKDSVDLAEKMITMIKLSSVQRAEMGRKGREKMIAQFDISHVIRIYDDAVVRLAGK